MAQSTSSAGSPSSERSSLSETATRNTQPGVAPSTDTLISYLLAAKRSLSSIHLVQRATSLLTEARSTIESTAVLIAKSKYVRRSLAAQIKILRSVQFELEGATHAVKGEIQAALNELESTDRRLYQTIVLLKSTPIDEGFKGSQEARGEGTDTVTKDTLHDFVDDRPVEELKANIQSAIDEIEKAETKVDTTLRTLEDDLQSINAALDSDKTAPISSDESNLMPLNIANVLRGLESHAHEMAVSLESLVRHFDLCVTAIRHTEGASALVARTVATADLPEGVDVNVEDLTAPGQEQELSNEERTEMLEVLSNDAAEVDEVVLELHDRATEMSNTLETLYRWRDRYHTDYHEAQTAFRLIDKLSLGLSSYTAEVNMFRNDWTAAVAQIVEGQSALSELTDVYTRFLDSYDGLIVETARRRSVKKQMLKIVADAHAKLEQLYTEDLGEREVFRTERGDFLPGDIWSGLGDLPSRWALVRVDGSGQGDDAGTGEQSIPELPRKAVEEALRRLRRKVEGEISAGNSHLRSHSGSASRSENRS